MGWVRCSGGLFGFGSGSSVGGGRETETETDGRDTGGLDGDGHTWLGITVGRMCCSEVANIDRWGGGVIGGRGSSRGSFTDCTQSRLGTWKEWEGNGDGGNGRLVYVRW